MASIPPLLIPVQPVNRLYSLLKVGEQINAKVIATAVHAEETAITLKLNGQLLTVQASRPLPIAPGQTLSVEVSRLTPLTLTLLNPANSPAAAKPSQPPVVLTPIPTEDTASPNPANPPQPALGLTAKQQLPAVVVAIHPQKVQLEVTHPNASGEATKTLVEIDHSQLKSLPQNLVAGTAVTLETLNPNSDTAFNILPKTPLFTHESFNSLVKQLLPQHQTPEVLLTQLNTSLAQLKNSENLPQAVKNLIRSIVQALPEEPPHTAQTVKTSVAESGLFLEARLAHAKTLPELDLTGDFKAKLLKLNDSLQHILVHEKKLPADEQLVVKDLQQKTEHTLAAIVLDQLASLPKEDGSKPALHLEIPFLYQGQTQTVELKIDYELPQQQGDADTGEQTRDWTVKLNLDPPGLGNISCTIVCWNQQISTYFLSSDDPTTALLDKHLDNLKHQLENAGLAVGQIIAHNQPSGSHPDLIIKPDSNLFNDKA